MVKIAQRIPVVEDGTESGLRRVIVVAQHLDDPITVWQLCKRPNLKMLNLAIIPLRVLDNFLDNEDMGGIHLMHQGDVRVDDAALLPLLWFPDEWCRLGVGCNHLRMTY